MIRTDQPENRSPEARQPVFQTHGEEAKFRKRNWYLLGSAAAGLVAMVLAGLFLGYTHLRHQRLPVHRNSEIRANKSSSPFDAIQQPFALLETKLHVLQRELQKNLPLIMEEPLWRSIADMLEIADFQQAKLFLFSNPEHQLLPTLVLLEGNTARLKAEIASGGSLKSILQPGEDATYRLGSATLKMAYKIGFPAESYRVWFHDDWIVCAPMSQSHLWMDGQKQWLAYSVVRFATSVHEPDPLAVLSVRVPEDLPPDWSRALIPESLKADTAQSDEINPQASDFLAVLDRSLRQVESLAGAFRFVENAERRLQYAQQFREGFDGDLVFNRLQAGVKPNDRSSMGAIVSKLLHNDRLDTTVELLDDRLTVGLRWQAEDDPILMRAATEAVFGPTAIETPPHP